MSLPACLPGLVADGKLTDEQAADARALYDEQLAEFVRSGSPEAAEALASRAVLDALERQVTRKEFLAGRTIKVRNRIAADLGGFGGNGGRRGGGGTGGPIDPAAGPALVDRNPRARFSNVEGRRMAVLGEAHRKLDKLLREHSADLAGRMRKPAQMADMVRELFGQATGNEAAAGLARAWRETAEMLRRRFNAAGGDVGFRADWGLPQSHDWKKVRAAGFEAWRAAVLPRLDPARMIDQRTGRAFTREGLENALPEVFETIRSNGWSTRTPGSPAKAAMANRRGDPRFLVFKDPDSWAEYAAQFGGGTPYDAMMGHVEGMAREIAAMDILGPNPAATLEWVKGTIEKSAAMDREPGSKAVARARAAGKRVDDLWAEYTLSTMEPRNETLALVFSTYRSLKTAASLGSAYLSAASDFAYSQARRSFTGLSGPGTLFADYVKAMRPGTGEWQKMAVRRGLIADEWSQRTAAYSRLSMDELTGEIPRRLASGVLRLSLISRHTQMAKWVHGMEMLSTFTEAVEARQDFDMLDPALRAMLQRYGMGATQWDTLRSAPLETDRGVEWIAPHRLEDQELASRFMEMVHEETNLAVPVADLATRSIYNTKLERGTWLGELGRSGPLMFRSFGISVLVRQANELLAMNSGQAARYAAGLVIGTTLLGAVSLQLKALAAGKDPRPMAERPQLYDAKGQWDPSPGFWGAAMAQGGGFGIAGDFIYSAESRTGNGLAVTLAGPIAQDVQGVIDMAGAKHPGAKALKLAKGWVPGNNLWYSRLVFDRIMADQLEEMANPDYRQARRRVERYAAEQGTSYWWAPGDDAPRAPDLSNAFSEGPRQ